LCLFFGFAGLRPAPRLGLSPPTPFCKWGQIWTFIPLHRQTARRLTSIVHTVQVQHLHLAQFGLAGPTLALKVQGACHTLSATSLSEVALRRTCTESIRKKSTLKTALTKKKTKFVLSTLGVIYFLIYLPNYRKKLLQRRPRQPLLPHPIMMLRSLRMMS